MLIDIHCHILHGIDDGAQDVEESIKMAKIAAVDGIRTIVATPHVKNGAPSCVEITRAVFFLNQLLTNKGIPVVILQGADVPSSLNPADLHHRTINGTKYILTEFPHSHVPANARETLFNLCLEGFTPIITHPERNPSVIRNPDILLGLLTPHVKVQITADSLTGHFGANIAACARFLLKKGAVDILATDAHSSTYRRPILSGALKIAQKIIGKPAANKLVNDNPAAVISGAIIS